MREGHPTGSVSLNVLPHSGKAEQLRREFEADPITPRPSEPDVSTAGIATPSNATVHQKLIEGRVIAAIRTVYDPEIPINIYELGLIYSIDVRPDDTVHVTMTLTAPGCPVAGTLPGEVANKVRSVDGVKDAEVQLVWEPAWDKGRMSEAALLELGML